MGHYPFTLFNGITLFVPILTFLVVWQRFRGRPGSNWPLVCYAVMVGYTIGFSGGLSPYWVAAECSARWQSGSGFILRACGWRSCFRWDMWRGGPWACS